ncbi:MAG: acyloxyacyl hydrolase [Chitinophagaceae bacterium]|nr:acyloxyacyl hydrolase [Chitinophagaceae bacterium]
MSLIYSLTNTVFKCSKFLLLLLLLAVANVAVIFAQAEQRSYFGFESNLLTGKIFKHTRNFKGPIPPISSGIDVNILWKTKGKNDWQSRRRYPTIGLGISYMHYDSKYYGYGVGIYPNLELPLLRKAQWEWTMRFGMGLGYISKQYRPYAPFWDTLNNAIGSQINNYSLLHSDIRFHINSHWDLQAGITFTHMSSARFRQPNLGVNFIGGHVGFRYFPEARHAILRNNQLPPNLTNRLLLQARQGIAITTRESAGSAATPVLLSSISLSKRYWSKNKILFGLDYSYNQNVYDFMRLQAINTGSEKKYAWNAGIFLGHEFLYGRVGLQMQIGAYLHQTLLPKAPIYQRLGMNWYLLQAEKGAVKELYISTLLKTHYATAELAELGLGISF